MCNVYTMCIAIVCSASVILSAPANNRNIQIHIHINCLLNDLHFIFSKIESFGETKKLKMAEFPMINCYFPLFFWFFFLKYELAAKNFAIVANSHDRQVSLKSMKVVYFFIHLNRFAFNVHPIKENAHVTVIWFGFFAFKYHEY